MLKHDWTIDEVIDLFNSPLNDLLFESHTIHRKYFNPNEIQVSTLLSIKTGACPEDCSYCSQSVRYDTNLEKEKLLTLEDVLQAAEQAKLTGSTRFCMGAAWRNPTDKSLDKVIEMIKAVKSIGMETCVTLGMLTTKQAKRLNEAGLDYYNHNLDTSKAFYSKVITTRTFQDRLNTLDSVRRAGINVCSGGILGLGESQKDRASMLQELANMKSPPESVPINELVKIKGTPMSTAESINSIDFIRTIAVARILMPKSYVRLSAGRTEMSDEMQAMCFFAGANSIFYGERLLTTDNPDKDKDKLLFERLGLKFEAMKEIPVPITL